MVKYATRTGTVEPYSIPNPGPTPKIDQEEGLPPGALDIVWVEDSRKNLYHWSEGLKWHDRLHAHATMNSARRNHKCRRPFEPKDELDFVLDSIYDPLKDPFSEKQDVYLQVGIVLPVQTVLNNLSPAFWRGFRHPFPIPLSFVPADTLSSSDGSPARAVLGRPVNQQPLTE